LLHQATELSEEAIKKAAAASGTLLKEAAKGEKAQGPISSVFKFARLFSEEVQKDISKISKK
jgi:hypothetical protein